MELVEGAYGKILLETCTLKRSVYIYKNITENYSYKGVQDNSSKIFLLIWLLVAYSLIMVDAIISIEYDIW